MQIETLKIFCDVVRTASFSRGAAENGVAQSSASHAVQELEKRLGVRLIDRSKRPLVLTASGRLFFDGCKDLVARYFELENRVKVLAGSGNLTGTVRLGAIYSVGLHHMARYVESFQQAHPGVEVRLEYLHPREVLEGVRASSVDLGLLSFPKKWSDLVVIPWREEPMMLVVRPDHQLADRETITVSELDGANFVGFDPELSIRRAVDRFLRVHDVHVEIRLEFDNIENIKRAIEDLPGGAAILPEPALARERAAGTLRAIPFRDATLSRPLAILHRRTAGELSLAATHFLQLLTGDVSPLARPPDAAASKRGAVEHSA